MPVPFDTERIDLVVSDGLPSFLSALENVLRELEIRPIELAEEMKTMNLEILEEVKLLLPDTSISFISHEETRKELNNYHTFIRISEMTPYVNIILVNGVAL